jgi:D-glycero-alpha-D-manno-heptose-7-phosphate kinase
VSLAGGGSDFPKWYEEHGGKTIGFSLSKFCYISLRALPPYSQNYKHRIVYSKIELVNEHWEIDHPAVAAVLADQCVEEGLEVTHAGDVPARAGLGSSSAFTVALLLALSAHRGRMMSKEKLASEAIRIEQRIEVVGSQDQCFAAHGGFLKIDFDAAGPHVSRLILPPERADDLLRHLLLVFTRLQRTAPEVEARKMATLALHHSEMRRLVEAVDEVESILTDPFDLDASALGAVLEAGWFAKRALAPGVSSDDLDALYRAAKAAGAYGGKLLGAGGGGCFLFAVDPERRANVLAALPGLVEIPLGIDQDGARVMVYEPNGLSR